MDQLVAFDRQSYFIFLGVLALGRGMDILSTWIATPRLLLEANPLARRLGWKWGAVLNVTLCVLLAAWPMPAIVVATTSFLVASRNFQSAWLMRSMGEARYQCFIADQLSQTPWALFLFCVLAQATLVALIGAALMVYSGWQLVPFGVGSGMITYGVAIAFYTLLAAWRRRSSGTI
ncbi:MAG TPA: hypothetical protein VHH73_02360 [Verrucomicrobiae bacterium]|nr:hypothetical protein [Verrucomicrobiae bacterium]